MINKNKDQKNLCSICGKKATIGNNKPHSQHRTKRVILPNIQKNHGLFLCTRCLKSASK